MSNLVLFAFEPEFPMVTASPVFLPEDAPDMAVPDGKSQTVNTPLEEADPGLPQRTARLLNVPLVVIKTCWRVLDEGGTVQVVDAVPAPDIVSVADEDAVPAQNTCAVRRFLPVQPEQVPLIVTLLRVVVPVSVSPFTVGAAARTTLPEPTVFDSCEELIWPLLSPSGIPAHVPGVPAATFTQAAIPFADALEFCSMSPCAHAKAFGAEDDFVGI